jgi:hypothetical protein
VDLTVYNLGNVSVQRSLCGSRAGQGHALYVGLLSLFLLTFKGRRRKESVVLRNHTLYLNFSTT